MSLHNSIALNVKNYFRYWASMNFLLACLIAISLSISSQSHGDAVLHKTIKHASGDVTLKRVIKKGEMIVRYKNGDRRRALGAMRVGAASVPTDKGVELVNLAEDQNVDDAVEEYSARDDVLYAEPNYMYFPSAIPDDSQFTAQWGMNNVNDVDVNGPEGWDIEVGSEEIVIGVIDTGVDYNHPDLANNMWVNPGEIPGNGLDDDGNGWIDDVHGIDTFNDDGDPMDDDNHGTHVAGIIAAHTDNALGVAGTSWNTKIIACKFMNTDGGNTLDAVRCLEYFRDLKAKGVNIVATNNSWGGDWNSVTLHDAIEEQQDANILFVASANNDGRDIDLVPSYPASYDLANVVTVAAYNESGNVANFSNYGRKSVDVAAPGQQIISTIIGDSYGYFNGTSMAAPHVAGLVGLLAAQDNTRTWLELRNLVLSSGKDYLALQDTTQTGKGIRLADNDGSGALSCTTGLVNRPMAPVADTQLFAGETLELEVMAIECDSPLATVQATISTTGETIDLLDDGVGADKYANDGIFSSQWVVPDSHDAYELQIANETLTVTKRIPQADLVARLGSVNLGWYWGGKIQFNARVENIGTIAAENVTLSTLLPEGTTFESAIGPDGNCVYDDASHRVNCDFDQIAAESIRSVRVAVVPESTTAKYTFETSVTTTSSEFDEDNNEVSKKYGGAIKLVSILLLLAFAYQRRKVVKVQSQ